MPEKITKGPPKPEESRQGEEKKARTGRAVAL
jgi:hypothetical protein